MAFPLFFFLIDLRCLPMDYTHLFLPESEVQSLVWNLCNWEWKWDIVDHFSASCVASEFCWHIIYPIFFKFTTLLVIFYSHICRSSFTSKREILKSNVILAMWQIMSALHSHTGRWLQPNIISKILTKLQLQNLVPELQLQNFDQFLYSKSEQKFSFMTEPQFANLQQTVAKKHQKQ